MSVAFSSDFDHSDTYSGGAGTGDIDGEGEGDGAGKGDEAGAGDGAEDTEAADASSTVLLSLFVSFFSLCVSAFSRACVGSCLV